MCRQNTSFGIHRFLDILFPPRCILCRNIVADSRKLRHGLCDSCLEELALQRIGGNSCISCGQRLVSESGTCVLCRKNDYIGIPAKAVFSYRGAARFLIRRYKFNGIRTAAEFFSICIAELIPDNMKNYLIVPLPSGKGSRRRNGWGHMETVAAFMAKNGFTSAPGLLKRIRKGEQKGLSREERQSSGQLFSCRPCRKKGNLQRVIIIDDVRTTGASLRSAEAALRIAGYTPALQIVIAID